MHRFWIKRVLSSLCLIALVLGLTGCSARQNKILTNVSEKDANQILVLLESKGIQASKEEIKTQGATGGDSTGTMFDILVEQDKSIEALAILNRIGLPRQKGVTLLDLFPQQGMMKTDKEEQIRYNQGLNEELASTIQMIDGVLAAEVQIAFPETDQFNPDQTIQYPRASVFVKHDGILDDPNNLIVQKIRRYIAGSVLNLRYEDVTVVTDRARFTDISVASVEPKMPATPWGNQDYVRIWSVIVADQSVSSFRTILFLFCLFTILFVVALGWTFWKFQNYFKTKEGIKAYFSPEPFNKEQKSQPAPEELKTEEEEEEEGGTNL